MHVRSMEWFGGNPSSQSSTSCLSEDSQDGNTLMVGANSLEEKKLKRRQKNRAAAQRSRQKHTEKADELHQQHELLEKANAALQKEIEALTKEAKKWTQTLKDHEPTCLLGSPDICQDLLTSSLPTQPSLPLWLVEGLDLGIQ